MTAGHDANVLSVAEIMSPNPKSISPMDSLDDAETAMLKDSLCHLPVVDRKGDTIGMLTPKDFSKEFQKIAQGFRATVYACSA